MTTHESKPNKELPKGMMTYGHNFDTPGLALTQNVTVDPEKCAHTMRLLQERDEAERRSKRPEARSDV